jgi:hypothetical protein
MQVFKKAPWVVGQAAERIWSLQTKKKERIGPAVVHTQRSNSRSRNKNQGARVFTAIHIFRAV